jgi:hypothetical protein
VDKFSSTGQTFDAKTPKEFCRVNVLEALVRWPLVFNVKAKWTNFGSPPIKLLELLVRSTDGRSVKCPSEAYSKNLVSLEAESNFISLGHNQQLKVGVHSSQQHMSDLRSSDSFCLHCK